MAIPCYLAMTAAEVASATVLPENMAWMACHFSCYGAGLSNLPAALPEKAMVIIDDCTPIHGHDPMYILEQLQGIYDSFHPDSFLLDFQRPGNPETACLSAILSQRLPCPVGVSEQYAGELDCPVFLTAPPLHIPLEKHIAPWKGRKIWLEAALEAEIIRVTKDGAKAEITADTDLSSPSFEDTGLSCHYCIDLQKDAAVFHLARQKEDISRLLAQAEGLGVSRAVGLYQQLGNPERS